MGLIFFLIICYVILDVKLQYLLEDFLNFLNKDSPFLINILIMHL